MGIWAEAAGRRSKHTCASLNTFNNKMSDSDSGEKKGGIPSWQTAAPEKEEEKTDTEPENREKVLEQAKKFLEEDEVKDASTDKKVAFLESKGLQGEEIQSLLGVSRNEEASNSTATPLVSPPSILIAAITHFHSLPNNLHKLHKLQQQHTDQQRPHNPQ